MDVFVDSLDGTIISNSNASKCKLRSSGVPFSLPDSPTPVPEICSRSYYLILNESSPKKKGDPLEFKKKKKTNQQKKTI